MKLKKLIAKAKKSIDFRQRRVYIFSSKVFRTYIKEIKTDITVIMAKDRN